MKCCRNHAGPAQYVINNLGENKSLWKYEGFEVGSRREELEGEVSCQYNEADLSLNLTADETLENTIKKDCTFWRENMSQKRILGRTASNHIWNVRVP